MIRPFALSFPGRLHIAVLSVLLPLLASTAVRAEEPEWRTATTLGGEPHYAADFAHFDYVNPDAPKGGEARFGVEGNFDSTNLFLGTKGTPATSVASAYESLFTASLDELDISATYPLLADAMRYPSDFAWAEYRLDPKARWQDGEPVTVDDVIWSFDTLKEIYPLFGSYYSHVTKAEATDDRVVRFTFDAPGNRELPHILGQLYVLPKHWWQGKDASGKQRNIRETTLEPPLGSGPYKVTAVDPGRRVTLVRDPDYWGAKLPVSIGSNNFDRLIYDYYVDPTVLMEAFKADKYDFRAERSAKMWATGYDFPAKNEGKVVTMTFPRNASGVMQALVPNLRLAKYQDARVRRALNLAFDYETLKRTVFFNLYDRIDSFYFGTELAAKNLPSPGELSLLEPLRDKLPPAVFTTPYANPVGGTPEAVRENLQQAVALFAEAGWTIRDGKMRNAKGEPFRIEYLTFSSLDERYISPFAKALGRIGIDLDLRLVDDAQYLNRTRSFDFDMTVDVWGQSLSPGNEQREMWGSKAADLPGSRNTAGIKNPAVDALIEKVIYAENREALVTATRALDRVLLAGNYVIPLFYSKNSFYAYWKRFGHPEALPKYSVGFPDVWWYDPAVASAAGLSR
ncbi:extracellular solute-binding protein [Pleomorphomonas sp. JP5]|uniref:extracellular solute-binding protein n=1 Tax=Pleomorphomonas sp. JP5 TaxID=2942998 RepID=UPI0020435A25|nr:extracellular solute-binding protein [Pleomorphomonas sp. JP5]MCM5559622.1 extracellular solute-binding protein [Pleomorphomonas sp. JP5]